MPTIENLERLEGLVKTLTPLASKQRGELIEASQWNQLVDGVLEVARASLAGPVDDSVPQHTHTDVVGLAWLTPKLRSLVSEGGLSDPASQSAVAKLDRKVDRLATRMDELADKMARFQADLAGVQTKDVVRQSEVTELGRKIDGVRDSRDDVAQLRTSLNTIASDVQTAVAAVGSLTADGQLIDVAALVDRVNGLDSLRGSLTTPDGNVLSAAEYERRIEELRAQLVTEDELRSSLEGLRDEFGGFDSDAILEDARTAAHATVDEALVGFEARNSANLDQRFAAQKASIDATVAAATGDLTASILDQAKAQWEPAISDGLKGLEDTIGSLEAMRDTATRNALTQEITRVESGIADQAAKVASETVAASLTDVQASISANTERLAGVEARTAKNSTDIADFATRLEATRRILVAADAKLQEDLGAKIDEVSRGIDSRLDDRIPVLRNGLREDLKSDLSSLGRDIENRIGGTIRGTVATEVGITSGRLRSEISSMVDTEVAGVREDVNTRIEAGLATNSARLAGLVTNEVRRATGDLDGRVERAVNAFRPEMERLATGRPVVRTPGG